MAMKSIIRFRVPPKLEQRALKVLRRRNVSRAKAETLSDFGREGFLARLELEEKELGLTANNGKAST